MPTPIAGSSNNTSAPVPQPETPLAGASTPPRHVVTIEPVVIEGDAGKQELLKRHAAAAGAPDCRQEKVLAGAGALTVGGAALVIAGGSLGGPIGVAGALIGLFAVSVAEGTQLRALKNCREQ